MRSASRPGSTPAAMVHAASDRRPCGTEHALRLFSDHGIAAAASSFETGAVYYRDVVAAGADELLAFKLVQSGGHAGPADAEHKGEIFVRERHAVIRHAVVREQEPARQALLDHVPRVARRGLRCKAGEHVREV